MGRKEALALKAVKKQDVKEAMHCQGSRSGQTAHARTCLFNSATRGKGRISKFGLRTGIPTLAGPRRFRAPTFGLILWACPSVIWTQEALKLVGSLAFDMALVSNPYSYIFTSQASDSCCGAGGQRCPGASTRIHLPMQHHAAILRGPTTCDVPSKTSFHLLMLVDGTCP